MTPTIRAFAPAKVNLTLHVTGQRADGYHLLDSIVVFVGVGDWVTARAADGLSLTVAGEGAELIPTDGRNLVVKAARLLDQGKGAALHLDKTLPASSGIGGGSSDAAATLRALARLWDQPELTPAETLPLGADLPVCMAAVPTRMRGIGEQLDPLPALPDLHMVLVNPRQGIATPHVFRHLTKRDNPAMGDMPGAISAAGFVDWLAQQRNDLQAPAIEALPVIADGIAGLNDTENCLLARMSGSGATCFGLYATAQDATAAERRFRVAYPDWWAASGPVLKDAQSTRATT